MNEPGVGTISLVLCRLQAERLARMVSIIRIHNKQYSIFSDKNISVYGKLQKRVKNRGKHKEKRKSGESNGVCGKNKAGVRRDRDSFKKGLGGYEEISE